MQGAKIQTEAWLVQNPGPERSTLGEPNVTDRSGKGSKHSVKSGCGTGAWVQIPTPLPGTVTLPITSLPCISIRSSTYGELEQKGTGAVGG